MKRGVQDQKELVLSGFWEIQEHRSSGKWTSLVNCLEGHTHTHTHTHKMYIMRGLPLIYIYIFRSLKKILKGDISKL
jgi:hypothetical protein